MRGIFLTFCLSSSLFAQWEQIDSISIICRVAAKSSVWCNVNLNTGKLFMTLPASTRALTAKAIKAIAFSPQWLAVSLEDRFAGLNATQQDSYAQIILNARDPLVDEIAFTIAHLPIEIINNKGFYPDIIIENAQWIYRADSALEYVRIIDSGSAAAGGDYFSTTRYRVKKNSVIEDYTLPREIYYWFVVYPKLQGELPAYIAPNDPNPTSPSAGYFWRPYFLTHRENGCGSLQDTMKGVSFLWANRVNSLAENGALGRLSQWCNRVLPWGGGTPQYRWPQPVYIYNQHRGTCSEHGWFANAAGRAALIPVTLTKAPRFDHKWNEFYCGRWIDWEPINGWIDRIDEEPSHANDYWADPSKSPLNGCFNWRGDGFIWGTTERYSLVCTLCVSITDAEGAPLDGARIIVDAEGVPGNFLMAGWTGSDGKCRFLLGDSIRFFTASIKSALGDIASKTVITNSLPGKRYDWQVKLPASLPALKAQPVAMPQNIDQSGEYRIVYSINAEREIVYGRHEYSVYGYSFPCTFSDERLTGTTDFFVCDQDNFSACSSGQRFDAAIIKTGAAAVDGSFSFPYVNGSWYAVLSGERKTTNTTIARILMRLLRRTSSGVLPASEQRTCNGNPFSLHIRGARLYVTSSLPATTHRLRIQLFTARGEPAAILFEGAAGCLSLPILLDLSSLAPGIYYCRLTTTKESFSSRVVMVK